MIIRGVEYPQSVMTQLIGEQALTIDNLEFQLVQANERYAQVCTELASLRERVRKLVESLDGRLVDS